MTLEEKVVAEIKEVLERNKCVLTVREVPLGRFFNNSITEIRVLRQHNELGTTLGAVLHSE